MENSLKKIFEDRLGWIVENKNKFIGRKIEIDYRLPDKTIRVIADIERWDNCLLITTSTAGGEIVIPVESCLSIYCRDDFFSISVNGMQFSIYK